MDNCSNDVYNNHAIYARLIVIIVFLLVIGGVRMSRSNEQSNFGWKMSAASGTATLCLLGVLVAACVAPLTAEAEEAVRYNRDIRPILARICFECHGPDSASRAADLRLDEREDAIELRGHRSRRTGRQPVG